jgi:putative phage-type endonuclease
MTQPYVKICDSRKSRPDWLKMRQLGIGASDSPTIMNLNEYESRYTLFMQRTGSLPKIDHSSYNESDNEAMEWGRELEDLVARRFSVRAGWKLRRGLGSWLLQSTAHEHLCATPDREGKSPRRRTWGLIEVKTTNEYSSSDWTIRSPGTVTGIGENGLKQAVPERYWCQLQHQLAVTGRTYGAVVCLIGGQRLVWAEFARDNSFIAELILQTKAFWEMLQNGVVPEPDDSPSTYATLQRLREDGRVVTLPREAVALKNQMAELSTLRTESEQKYKETKRRLAALLGTASYGILPDDEGGVKFVTVPRDGYTVEATEYRDLRVHKKVNKTFLNANDRPERPPVPPVDPALL